MKCTSSRSLKILAAVSLVAVLGLAVFQLSRAPRLEELPANMRLDAERNPLVVLVLIDTLRRDHVAALGYDRATTPNLDRLASEGFVASGMLTHASQTVPSVASIFTSKPPHEHGIQFDLHTEGFGNQGESKTPLLAEDNLTLAEVLSQKGYATAAVVANPWLRRKFGFAQGFDEYQGTGFSKVERGLNDGAEINDAASRLIREHSADKTFLYLHYMDVHSPYAHAGKLPRVFRKGPGRVVHDNGPVDGVSAQDLAYSIGAYDDGLVYTDALIGKLAQELEAAAAERDVLLVVTSDHGEEFLEHGGMGHGSTLYPELLQTFAIFWRPDKRLLRPREARLSGTMDIAPTLLDLVGVPTPKEMAGRSLLRPYSDRIVISELARKKAAIKNGWGVVRDLDTHQDEVVAYAGASTSEPSADLIAELGSRLDSLEFRTMTVNNTAPNPDLVRQLRALGYMK